MLYKFTKFMNQIFFKIILLKMFRKNKRILLVFTVKICIVFKVEP